MNKHHDNNWNRAVADSDDGSTLTVLSKWYSSWRRIDPSSRVDPAGRRDRTRMFRLSLLWSLPSPWNLIHRPSFVRWKVAIKILHGHRSIENFLIFSIISHIMCTSHYRIVWCDFTNECWCIAAHNIQQVSPFIKFISGCLIFIRISDHYKYLT